MRQSCRCRFAQYQGHRAVRARAEWLGLEWEWEFCSRLRRWRRELWRISRDERRAFNLRNRPDRAGLTRTDYFARETAESLCLTGCREHRVQGAKVNALRHIPRINS